jgi:hypothetical protein
MMDQNVLIVNYQNIGIIFLNNVFHALLDNISTSHLKIVKLVQMEQLITAQVRFVKALQ